LTSAGRIIFEKRIREMRRFLIINFTSMKNNSKNAVVHFEMPYEDKDRLSDFYFKAFGWEMNKLGEEMGHYVVAHTAETDEKNMNKTVGAINGGFFPKIPNGPQNPSLVISVENIQEAMEKVKKFGGEVIGEPMDIPGVGKYVSFSDTEGNRVSLLEAKEM
jgi:uncharacterized protein